MTPPSVGFAETAQRLARDAGTTLRARLGGLRHVGFKGEVDLVTDADREAEQFIVSGLRSAFPTHRIVAEESGGHGKNSGFVWYVDPLDGTTNFVHTLPHFAVSIALEVQGVLQTCAVYDPMRDELFHATRGRGSFLGEAPIRVSQASEPSLALVATGFPYDRRTTASRHLAVLRRVLEAVRDVRRAGAAALDLAWVACGRLDAYWESGLQPWDTAAGTLLVREGGGTVSAIDGSDCPLPFEGILASNGRLHAALGALVRPRVDLA